MPSDGNGFDCPSCGNKKPATNECSFAVTEGMREQCTCPKCGYEWVNIWRFHHIRYDKGNSPSAHRKVKA